VNPDKIKALDQLNVVGCNGKPHTYLQNNPQNYLSAAESWRLSSLFMHPRESRYPVLGQQKKICFLVSVIGGGGMHKETWTIF